MGYWIFLPFGVSLVFIIIVFILSMFTRVNMRKRMLGQMKTAKEIMDEMQGEEFCQYCGSKTTPEDKTCPSCGAKQGKK